MVVDRNWEGEAGEADGRRTWSKDGLVDIIEYSELDDAMKRGGWRCYGDGCWGEEEEA